MKLPVFLCAAACAALAGCGGNSAGTVNMTLTAGGFTPNTVSVRFGYNLTFVNQDNAAHQVSSTACPDLASTRIPAGSSFTVPISNTAEVGKSCDVFDSLGGTTQGFTGTVKITGAG